MEDWEGTLTRAQALKIDAFFMDPPEATWSDDIFVSDYYKKVPNYKRPSRGEAMATGKAFIAFYRSGVVPENHWGRLLLILGLYLKIDDHYVLTPPQGQLFCELPTLDSPEVLPLSIDMKFDKSQAKKMLITQENCDEWYTTILNVFTLPEHKNEAVIDDYLYYLGYLALWLLRIKCRFPSVVENSIYKSATNRYNTFWKKRLFNNKATPPPHQDCYSNWEFLNQCKHFNQFLIMAIQAYCDDSHAKINVIKSLLTDASFCVLVGHGLAVFTWFHRASIALKTSYDELLDMMVFSKTNVSIKWIKSFIKRIEDEEKRTWPFCRLLNGSHHSKLKVKNHNAFTGVVVALALSITDKSHDIWKTSHLTSVTQSGEIDFAISMANAIRKDLRAQKNKENPKDN